MLYKKPFKLMPMHKALLFIMMGAVTFSHSGCAVPIKDAQFCSPVPLIGGAVCDWMLHKDQKILTEAEWNELQGKWALAGNPATCTTSETLGDLKGELEKLCTVTRCNYLILQPTLDALSKIQALSKKAGEVSEK